MRIGADALSLLLGLLYEKLCRLCIACQVLVNKGCKTMAAVATNYPNSYQEASDLLGKRESKNLAGKATKLYRKNENEVAVQYHGTDIVTFNNEGEIYVSNRDTSGNAFFTVTTKNKINACLYRLGCYMYQSKGGWYLRLRTSESRFWGSTLLTVSANSGNPTMSKHYIYEGER